MAEQRTMRPRKRKKVCALPAVQETDFVRHVRFEKPIVIKMDGKRSLGVVLKPE